LIVDKEHVVAEVFRFDPTKDSRPRYDVYPVPHRKGLTVMTLLRYIYEQLDPTIAFRDYQCGTAVCNSCSLKINGKVKKACVTEVQPNEKVRIEPRDRTQVIRDLVSAVSAPQDE
jgi:succinate dehydrogenase / fumarate reductase, iron-sulfur subunit